MNIRSLRTAAAAAVVLAAASACSFIYSPEKTQCATTADCTARGPAFAGLICQTDQGVCVAEGGCSTNAECIEANGGKPFICNKAKRTCASLQTLPEDGGPAVCTPFGDAADLKNENTIWLGVIAGATGPLSSVGIPRLNFAELARRHIKVNAGGLPAASPGQPARPLAYIHCETGADPTVAVNSAKYLINEVGVPAIIGPDTYEEHVAVSTNVYPTSPVLAFPPIQSPFGGMPAPGDPRGVWSFVPSLDNTPTYMANAVKDVYEPMIRKDLKLAPTDKIRVAVVSMDYQLSKQLQGALVAKLNFNGQLATEQTDVTFRTFKYKTPLLITPSEYLALQDDLLNFKPHYVIGLGSTEFGTDILLPVEKKWTEPTFRPYWTMLALSLSAPLFEYTVFDPNLLSGRLSWTNFDWTSAEAATTFQEYKSEFPNAPDTFPLLDAVPVMNYDAMFAVAYTILANGANPVTGPNLIRAFPKVITPTAQTVQIGNEGLFSGFQILGPGGAGVAKLKGRIASFDLNPATGRVEKWPAVIQCLPTGKTAPENSGITFDVNTLATQGKFGCGRPAE